MKEKERVKLHFSFCHRKPERSFFWRGKQFPVCARCTGIHLGYLSFPFFLFGVISINFWLTILLIVPTYLDGFIQAYYNKESTCKSKICMYYGIDRFWCRTCFTNHPKSIDELGKTIIKMHLKNFKCIFY